MIAAILFCPLLANVARPEVYAVLVGVSDYENHTKLKAPPNDIRLVLGMLADWRVPTSNIRVLADKVTLARRPTRNNIMAELDRLAHLALKRDDTIFIYFTGHGAKAPQPFPIPANVHIEPDGMNEVFLPIDAKTFDPKAGQILNGIADKELKVKLDALRAKAFVWLVIDACHAGGLTRIADGDVIAHYVGPQDLGIAQRDIDLARKNARRHIEAQGPSSGRKEKWLPDDATGAGVAFLAVDADKLAIERPMPGRNSTQHSVFTYMLAKAAKRPHASFRQLARIVQEFYANEASDVPPPQFEGALDRPLHAGGGAGGEPVWEAEVVESHTAVVVAAGELQGLAAGAVLSLHDGQKHIGNIRIESADLLTSKAIPIDHDGLTIPDLKTLSPALTARVVRSAIPFVLVVAKPSALEPNADAPTRAANSAILHLIEGKNQAPRIPLTWVEARASADIYLRIRGDRIFLVPAIGMLASDDRNPKPSIRVGSEEGSPTVAADELESLLWRMLRQHNLARVANTLPRTRVADALKIRFTLQRDEQRLKSLAVRETQDCAGPGGASQLERTRPFLESPGPAYLTHCDVLGIEVENLGQRLFDLTLLLLDEAGGVTWLESLRPPIEPKTSDSRPYQAALHVRTWCSEEACKRFGKPGGFRPIGVQRLLAIAVERAPNAAGEQSYGYLAQPASLREAAAKKSERSRGDGVDPLGDLLEAAGLLPDADRAAIDTQRIGQSAMRMFRWDVVSPRRLYELK